MSAAEPDPRAGALAEFLRREAAAVSLSLEMTGFERLVHVGMALLDAAAEADRWREGDESLTALSAAGLFRSSPGGALRFVADSRIQRVLLSPVHGELQTGEEVLAHLVAAAGDR